jgi:CO dehydrogenase maturation factor
LLPDRKAELPRAGFAAAAARRPDPVHALAVSTPCGARLLAAGQFDEEDLGVSCYHAKIGAVERYLNHLADGPGEYVVVDCTTGLYA